MMMMVLMFQCIRWFELASQFFDGCLEAALEGTKCNHTGSEPCEVWVEETEVDEVARLVDHILVFLRHSDGQSVALEEANGWGMVQFEV